MPGTILSFLWVLIYLYVWGKLTTMVPILQTRNRDSELKSPLKDDEPFSGRAGS